MAMFDPEPVAPEPAPVARPRNAQPQRRSVGTSLVLGLAAVVAIGGLAFAAGRLTAPPAAAASGFNGAGRNFTGTGGEFPRASGQTGGFAGLRGGGGFGIQGTVTAVTSDQLTLQLANGTTINIPLTTTTTYHQQTAGAASDVQVGKQVQVQLERNTSGTGGAAASPGAGGGFQVGSASSVTVLGQ